MRADYGPSIIPLPAIVDKPAHIGRLSRDVRKAVSALANRKVVITGSCRKNGGSVSVTGAFNKTFVEDDITYLQGGTVSGGTGLETVANIEIKDDLGEWVQATGVHIYLAVTGDGIVADGVLLPGFNITGVTVGYNATIPANTIPTYDDEVGKTCHIDLGVFTVDNFYQSASGNLDVKLCHGSYTVTRII